MFLKQVEAQAMAGMSGNGEPINRPIPQFMHLVSFKPNNTQHLMAFLNGVMRGPSPLTTAQREMIAALTSKLNECPFCLHAHTAIQKELTGTADDALIQAVLNDYQTAPISDQERALCTFVEKVVKHSYKVHTDDIATLKQVGWSEEALYDAITVISLFQFMNTWVNASGVEDMPAEGYALLAQQMAPGYTFGG